MNRFASLLKARRVWLTGLAVVIAAGVAVGAYFAVNHGNGQASAATQQFIPIQYGNLVNQVSLSGSVAYSDIQTLAFGGSGIVGSVAVTQGQTVKKGDPIASLDAQSVASLKQAALQAQVSLQNAQQALAAAKNSVGNPDLLAAQTKVANDQIAVENAQTALDDAQQSGATSSQAIAAAKLKVANDQTSVQNALDQLNSDQTALSTDTLTQLQQAVTGASSSLALAQQKLATDVANAQDAYNTAWQNYQDAFQNWLGATITPEQATQSPEDLLASWGANLNTLFSSNGRYQDLNQNALASGPPPDNTSTPWNETVIYNWLNFYPGTILGTCPTGTPIPKQGVCVQSQLDSAWTAYTNAKNQLNSTQTSDTNSVTNATNALQSAQKALQNATSPEGIAAKVATLQQAQANLATDQANLTKLQSGPDPLQVALAQSQLAQAKANLAADQQSVTDIQNNEKTQLALLQAKVDTAQSGYDQAAAAAASSTLVAPISGVVTNLAVKSGQSVGANATVASIADPSKVEVDASVDEIDLLYLQTGATATVSLDALPGQTLSGTVSYIAPSGTTQSGVVTYPVTVTVNLPRNLQLNSGLSATANVVTRQENHVLLVPNEAIHGTFSNPYVEVKVNGKVQNQPITVGNSDNFWTVVKSGLNQGAEVAIPSGSTAATTGFTPGGGNIGAALGGLGGGGARFGRGGAG